MSSSVRLLGLQRKLLQTAKAFFGYGNPFKAIHRNFFDVHFLRNSSVTFGFGSKMASASGTSTTTTKTNRLAFEKSPYLLQHATNPVDWYPWGDEAFEKARAENKPIFLSVGYSTCHWCHVMERESFEDRAVAALLNARFVAVKVDREERPDVDKVYMTYVQRTTGGGGWPMSVFLTPNLEPVFGGTYFPPEDRYGRVGFKSLLKTVARQWEENHQVLGSKAKNAVEAIRRITSQSFATTQPFDVPSTETVRKCTQTFLKSYDAINGGFLDAPKFPQPSNYTYLFHVYFKDPVSSEGQEVLEACLHSLKRMAYGGIHDHVNTGFARYSVDARWHVPHFEKMLYDQGQLAVAYLEAYSISKDEFFKEIVEDILKYAARDLSHELGGFYGAEDADSYPEAGSKRKREGAFCVWEHAELGNLLPSGTDFELFCYHFNVKKSGNVPPQVDPHNELTNKNVLACFQSYEDTATAFKMTAEEVKNVLKNCCEILYEERLKRPKPHVDTKIVTAWNGLMMSGFARAGFTLKNQQYTDRAVKAASFIKRFLYDEKTKVLKRCCYKDPDGNVVQISTPISGFVQDYAFLIRGLIDVYEATLDFQWLKWAEDLQDTQDKLFWDSKDFGYFTSPEGDPSIVIRDKEDQDGAEPSGNSVSVHNLVRLASYLNREDLKDKAGKTLTAFAERLRQIAFALPEMTSGLMHYVDSLPQIIIVGSRDDPETEALLDTVRAAFIPGKVLMLVDGSSPFRDRIDSLDKMKKVRGRATAYVCRNFTCTLPVCDAEALENALRVESQKKSA